MAKPWAKAFYNSKAWRRCRDSFIDQRVIADGGLCEVCHEEPGYIVHHVKELTPVNILDPNISLNHSNLMFVCKKCHDKEHNVFCEREQKIFFDEEGNVLPSPR